MENIKVNSRFFHSYAKKKLISTTLNGSRLKENGTLENDPKEMTEMLPAQYKSVFSEADAQKQVEGPDTSFRDERECSTLTIRVTREDIIQAICNIALCSAGGPDGFHDVFLKNCKEQLATPMKILLNKSLITGFIPN